jgi:hypothetical protein
LLHFTTLVILNFGTSCDSLARTPVNCDWKKADTDVQPCLQAAADESGGTRQSVEVPAGTWRLGKALVLASNVTLSGAADGATILKPTPDNSSDPVLLSATGVQHVTVEHITFEGGGAAFANSSPVLKFTTATAVRLNDIRVLHTSGLGLVMQGGMRNSGVERSEFKDIGNLWRTTGRRGDRRQGLVFCCGENVDNFALDNLFEDIGLDALQVSNQVHFRAERNVFHLDNGQRERLKSADYPAGLFITYTSNSVFVGNRIFGAAGNGVDAPGVRSSVFADNEIRGCGAAGIGLFIGYDKMTEVRDIQITNNVLMDNNRWQGGSPFRGGVTIAGGHAEGITLENNTIGNEGPDSSQEFGVMITETATVKNLKITPDNRFSRNRRAPFNFDPVQSK